MSSILTVLNEASTNDLTVLATVKAELGITGNTQDANLARWITEASGVIGSQINRVLGEEDLREVFRLQTGGHENIVLRRRPVVTITSITEGETTIATDDYEFDSESGIVYKLTSGDRINWIGGKITVLYTAGYGLLDALPYALERAAIKLVGHYRATRTFDAADKSQSYEIPGVYSQRTERWVGSISENNALPPDVEDLLGPYRDHAVG